VSCTRSGAPLAEALFPRAVLRIALQAVLRLLAPVLVLAVISALTVLVIGLGAAAAPQVAVVSGIATGHWSAPTAGRPVDAPQE